MDKLKPLGSEKLQGDEKLQRILQLTYYNEVKKTTTNNQKPEYITETENGVYGITKEKDGYYVKKGLNEGTLDYIGGLFMKNKNKFSSYAEAFKRLDLLKGQESLQEETRYVIKNKKSAPAPAPASAPAPAPVAEPAPEEIPPVDDMGGEDMGDEMPPVDDMGGEDMGDEEFGIKGIQKLTGKLGQKLRDAKDELESDDLKGVLNSIISAIDLTKFDEEDKEEILANFEPEVDTMGSQDFETGDQELPDELENEDLSEFDIDPGDEESGGMDLGGMEKGEENSDDPGFDKALGDYMKFKYNEKRSASSEEKPKKDSEWPFPEFDLDETDVNLGDDDEISLSPEDELDKMGSKTKEFSLEELTDIVNKTVNDNLKNYFE